MKICPKCTTKYEDLLLEKCPRDGTPLKVLSRGTKRLKGRILEGRWIIEEKISEGGMGEVFRGRQVSVDRPVALKILRPALAASDEYVARFFREANIAASLQHPNFVVIYDYGQSQEDHLLYIAMEFLEGDTLTERLTEQLTLATILEIGIQIARALDVAHQAQIVHRDLKPENIFLIDGPDGLLVKVLDLGIARDLSTQRMTRTGQVFGTPEYMSPEQCRAQDSVDGRSDFYALGVLLYELVSGENPFERDSVIRTMLAQVTEIPPSLDELGLDIPAALNELLASMMQKDRSARPASARELLDSLVAIQDDLNEEVELALRRSRHPRLSEDLAQKTRSLPGMEAVNLDDVGLAWTRELSSLEPEAGVEARVEDEGSSFAKRLLWAGLLSTLLTVLFFGGWSYLSSPEAGPQIPSGMYPSLAAAQTLIDVSVVRAHSASMGESSRRTQALSEERAKEVAQTVGLIVETSQESAASQAGATPKTTTKPRAQTSQKTKESQAILPVRTRTIVQRTLARRERRDLLRCYNRRSALDDAGTFRYRIRISPQGQVEDMQVLETQLQDGDVLACMTQHIERWRFGESLTDRFEQFERTLTFGVE